MQAKQFIVLATAYPRAKIWQVKYTVNLEILGRVLFSK